MLLTRLAGRDVAALQHLVKLAELGSVPVVETNPSYARLVEPFGGHGERVDEPGELKPALERAVAAVNAGQVALLDVVPSA